MLPTLSSGEPVAVIRCAYGLRVPWPAVGGRSYLVRWRKPHPGDVVIAARPQDGFLVVKRVARVDAGAVFLLGDNREESLDSRDYGPVPIESIMGRVILFEAGGGRE